MTLLRLIALAAMEVDIGSAADCVTIYVRGSHKVPLVALDNAEQTMIEIFHEIGVSVHWARFPPRHIQETCATIEAQFDSGSTPAFRPGAMAYASVCSKDGTQVHVLTDRLLPRSSFNTSALGVLLGHVMAHEIGHVLEGIPHHSKQGLMKENWTPRDLREMVAERLRFTSTDANLIHLGLLRRLETGNGESCRSSQASDPN